MSLKGKLQRFKSHLTKEAAMDSPSSAQSFAPGDESKNSIPYGEVWEEMDAKPFYHGEEYAIVREITYPLDYLHGRYAFAQLAEVVERWNEQKAKHPLSTAGTSPSDLLFFDTETTGLHGGAGNTIFLLGYSRLLDDRVVVKQHFLPGPQSEAALYHGFLSDVQNLSHLITYNGKAFDWPQVKTRHTFHRDALPSLPEYGHLDLLHGARRLWKDQLESCRLSVVEEQILGIRRRNDTPGYLAPILYFDYLREKDPQLIKGVLHHNEMDVLSLICLYIHLSLLLLQATDEACGDRDFYEAGRWYEHLGEAEMALEFYQKAILMNGRAKREAQFSLAALWKKQKEWQKAAALWEELYQESPSNQIYLCIELAKAYEHVFKDYEKALYYADKALEHWKARKRGSPNVNVTRQNHEALLKRIRRLEMKCFGFNHRI